MLMRIWKKKNIIIKAVFMNDMFFWKLFNKEVYIISGCGSNKTRWLVPLWSLFWLQTCEQNSLNAERYLNLFKNWRFYTEGVEREKTNFFAGSAVHLQRIFKISTRTPFLKLHINSLTYINITFTLQLYKAICTIIYCFSPPSKAFLDQFLLHSVGSGVVSSLKFSSAV